MDHDEALIRCHDFRAILAVGVGLSQVRYAVRVVGAAAPCGFSLDTEVKRPAPTGRGGIDISAGSQQAEDAAGMPLYRGNVEGGEAVLGAAPVGVHVLAEHFVDPYRLATSGSGKQPS
eukprot:scaffold79656_cov60-Phaeocystis_antarctica.AAC.9